MYLLKLMVAAVGLGCCLAASAFAQPMTCTISEKHYCTLGTGCSPAVTAVWNTFDVAEATYSRCDRLGCDTYEATFSLSGVFTIIEVPGRGLLAKVSASGDFTEIATLGNDVYVSFGTCEL